jgi:hypothetical protein
MPSYLVPLRQLRVHPFSGRRGVPETSFAAAAPERNHRNLSQSFTVISRASIISISRSMNLSCATEYSAFDGAKLCLAFAKSHTKGSHTFTIRNPTGKCSVLKFVVLGQT